MAAEKETLGFYFTGHPLQACEQELKTVVKTTIDQLQASPNSLVIAGLLMNVRRVQTKRGKRMAILTLEDQTGRIEVTVFPDIYLNSADILNIDTILIIRGTINSDEYTGGLRMVADTVLTLDQFRAQLGKRLLIDLSRPMTPAFLQQLTGILKIYQSGPCPVVVIYRHAGYRAEFLLGDDWKIKPTDDLLNELQKYCGKDRVVLEYV